MGALLVYAEPFQRREGRPVHPHRYFWVSVQAAGQSPALGLPGTSLGVDCSPLAAPGGHWEELRSAIGIALLWTLSTPTGSSESGNSWKLLLEIPLSR